MTIDNIYFHVNKPLKVAPSIDYSKTIFVCYKNPSWIKQKIYFKWHSFFEKYGIAGFNFSGIRTFNSQMFTMHGSIIYNDVEYYVVIYPTHNELYPVAQ